MTGQFSDRTAQLRHLMQQAGWSSYTALRQAAGVPEKQIRNLRQGKLPTMRFETVVKLSRALHLSVEEFVAIFGAEASPDKHGGGFIEQDEPINGLRSPLCQEAENRSHQKEQGSERQGKEVDLEILRQEYDRLQIKLEQQKQELLQEFQQESLQALESLLLQLPTAMYAAQQNPQAPAIKLLPLLRPIDTLLQKWGIETIATVGEEVAYNPQQHQLMDGSAAAGDRVRVRYTGYRQGDRLLYRAKVSPVS